MQNSMKPTIAYQKIGLEIKLYQCFSSTGGACSFGTSTTVTAIDRLINNIARINVKGIVNLFLSLIFVIVKLRQKGMLFPLFKPYRNVRYIELMSIKHDNFSIVPEMLFMLFWILGLIKDLPSSSSSQLSGNVKRTFSQSLTDAVCLDSLNFD